MSRLFEPEELEGRAQRARALMDEAGVDALVVTGDFSAGLNYYYFSGHLPRDYQLNYSRPHVMVLPRDGEPFLYVYGVNAQNAVEQSWVEDVETYDPPFSGADLAAVMQKRGVTGRIGAELGVDQRVAMPIREYEAFRAALGDVEVVDASDLLWTLRMRKSDAELTYIKEADRINGEVHRRAFAEIQPGDTEVDVARVYGAAMVECGAVRPPYGQILIVSEAKSRALGHRARFLGPQADFSVSEGDLLFVDSGVVIEGYWAEFNRMGVVGQPTPEQEQHHSAIRKIVQKSIDETLVPGRSFRDVMTDMIGFCADFGYGPDQVTQYTGPPFFHLCHGIGLTSSEPPFVRMDSDKTLTPGMVLSVEAYLRPTGVTYGSEEDVVITDDGCEVFSDTDDGLFIIEGPS